MASLKKYDLSGKELGEVTVADDLLKDASVNSQLIKDYLVALRHNKRQWSANTKTRAQVKCTTAKPHPQKGLGRARQGSFVAPQYRGGGVAWGPKPKFEQSIHLNRKEKKNVIRSLIADKIQSQEVSVLEAKAIKQPKTKTFFNFLKALENDVKKVLFICDPDSKERENVYKSIRNLPKAGLRVTSNVNGYDLIHCDQIVVLDGAWENMKKLLS